MAPPSWALGGLIGGLLAAAILAGTMLFMEMDRSRELETQFAATRSSFEIQRVQHDKEMDRVSRQLTEVMRLRERDAADAQARLAVLEAAKGRRALQQGGDGADDDECLDPAHVAVAASDMAWAVSRAFDTHLGDEFPELVASVAALAEQLGAKADISTVDALILILAATPAAEEGRAALHANGCSASSTDSSTLVCEPPADGLVASGCSVTSGSGTCTPIPHTCATLPSACPFTTLQQTKADATVVTALQNALNLKADATAVDNLAELIGARQAAAETTPCRCASCADQSLGGAMCVPWGPAEPCD